MKRRENSLSQKSLRKSQIEKRNKIINDLILPKTHHLLKVNSISSLNPFKTLNTMNSINNKKEKEHELEQLIDDNRLFYQLFTKTKELYPTKVDDTFRDLIIKYRNNDYKIDLSEKKNLFNQNPLLLDGRDLEQYYMFNERSRNKNFKKNGINRKHINFIKKELFFMENILNQKNDIKNCVIKNEDNISYLNSHNSKEKETKYQSQKTNSLYDKIKSQQSSQKKLVSFEKKYFNQKLNSQKDINNKDKDKEKEKDNDNKSVHSYRAFINNKTQNKFNVNLSQKNINRNKSIKILPNIDTIEVNNKHKESHISKLKQKLFNINIKNEENKLQKEIDEIKITMNNKDLKEKNLLFKKKYKLKINKSIDNIKNSNNANNNITTINKTIPTSNITPFSLENNQNNNNEHIINNNSNKNINNLIRQKTNSTNETKKEPKKFNIFQNSKLSREKLFSLIKKRTIPYITLNKILREQNPQKLFSLLLEVDLKIFNRKEIEKLMRIYCKKILEFDDKKIEEIININKNDENIYKIIEYIIKKTKKDASKYSGKKSVKNDLDEVNNSIFDLRKKFILSKTFYET